MLPTEKFILIFCNHSKEYTASLCLTLLVITAASKINILSTTVYSFLTSGPHQSQVCFEAYLQYKIISAASCVKQNRKTSNSTHILMCLKQRKKGEKAPKRTSHLQSQALTDSGYATSGKTKENCKASIYFISFLATFFVSFISTIFCNFQQFPFSTRGS